MTWGQRGGQGVCSYNFFKSSRCLRHGTWCFCLALAYDCTGRGLRDRSWNSSDCQGPAGSANGLHMDFSALGGKDLRPVLSHLQDFHTSNIHIK